MKQIQKGEEPLDFINWKNSKKYEEVKHNSSKIRDIYHRFKKTKSIKTIVKDSLMLEQGSICCYCERRLETDDSHIEHLIPRDIEPLKALDFENLLCSCQKDLESGEPRHCGNAKGKNLLPITPLNSDCETRFIFAEDGQILPVQEDDQEAQITIDILQLNLPKLRALRREAIAVFLDPDLDALELSTFISDYLSLDSEGKYGEFWTTIHCLFGGFID